MASQTDERIMDQYGVPPVPLDSEPILSKKSLQTPTAVPDHTAMNGIAPSEAEDGPPFDVHTTEPGGPQSKAYAKLEPQTYVEGATRFPRISKPVELLRHEYDVVVIGSGYGGGVAASRMARADQSVCVLERGKERWPGEYPSNISEALPELHVSGEFAVNGKRGKWVEKGDPTGLYHLVVGEGQNAFVGNGLGGTSLLNANVCLRADPRTLKLNSWPTEIRTVPGSLDKYYDRAESVLEPTPYPDNFPALPKLTLLQKQAEALGLGNKFYRVPQTTKFENGPNSTGVEMQASALTGMDSTGVNDGSKSSTLVNYLSDAWNWGAEIFCECEARYIKKAPKGEGYIVYFTWHGAKRAAFSSNFYEDLMWVRAKKFVFLGAGTLGTGEILLRSQQMGLGVSKNLCRGMSGNGDILAFGYNTDYHVNGIGRSHPSPEHPIGPTINGVIDCRDQENVLDGFVIEEGAVPEALAPGLRIMLEHLPGRIDPPKGGAIQSLQRFGARQRSRILGPYTLDGSLQRTQTYLIMSHDSNQAIMTLKDDKPVLKFLGVGRSDHVNYLNGVLAEATAAVGGTYVNSPFYASLDQQEITVHPIGGANMSSDGSADHGVTTHLGEVLTGNGKEYYDGLVCVDASVIPLALGVNPFATITALAERSVEGVAKKKGIQIDYDTSNGTLNLFGQPAKTTPQDDDLKRATVIIEDAQANSRDGISFTEIMEGHMYVGSDIEEFEIAERVARGACSGARFFLSVHAWDTEALVLHNDHKAMITGTFTCGALSKDPFMVLRGAFHLFNQDDRTPDTRNLTYDFDMKSIDGTTIHFHGYKVVNSSAAFSPLETWRATSTLYVTLTRPDESVLGRGILRIDPAAFGSELSTFSPFGPDLLGKVRSTTQFLTFFSKQVAGVLLAPFRSLQWPTAIPSGYYRKKQPTASIKLVAGDNVQTTLHMWSPTSGTSGSPRVNVLLVPGAAVDHQIFALPTLKTNAVEYFQDAGYQVFSVTHRVGKTMVAQNGYTSYDARLDIKAALEEIRRRQQSDEKVYVVAHCAGSLAFSMGLLDGTIPGAWIRGVTASNVFMNPIFGRVNSTIASLPVSMAQIYRLFIGSWFSCASSTQDALLQQIINQVTRFYPVGAMDEICNSVTCHRSELVFGRLWTHKNLNEATHANLSKFLGGTSMRSLEHLMHMGTKGYVMTNEGKNLVTEDNLRRLKDIPMLLFSGSGNVVYSPESTDRSYTVLRDQHGPDLYERAVFEGRGHLDCWMGSSACTDVYPRVKRHIEKTLVVGA